MTYRIKRTMTEAEVSDTLLQALYLLAELGVAVVTDGEDTVRWNRVREWVPSRKTPRNATQAALYYLDLLKDELLNRKDV